LRKEIELIGLWKSYSEAFHVEYPKLEKMAKIYDIEKWLQDSKQKANLWINEANNDTENDQNIQVDKSDLNKITSDFDNKVCSTYGYSSLRNKRLNNT